MPQAILSRAHDLIEMGGVARGVLARTAEGKVTLPTNMDAFSFSPVGAVARAVAEMDASEENRSAVWQAIRVEAGITKEQRGIFACPIRFWSDHLADDGEVLMVLRRLADREAVVA